MPADTCARCGLPFREGEERTRRMGEGDARRHIPDMCVSRLTAVRLAAEAALPVIDGLRAEIMEEAAAYVDKRETWLDVDDRSGRRHHDKIAAGIRVLATFVPAFSPEVDALRTALAGTREGA